MKYKNNATPPPPQSPTFGWSSSAYYYYDPLLMKVDCGADSSDRDSAAAALLALSSMLRRERTAGVSSAVFGVFFTIVSFGMATLIQSKLVGAPLLFVVVPLLFAIIGVIFVVLSLRKAVRYGRIANILAEIARLVENGLVSPEEVCSKTVQTLIEYYRLKFERRLELGR